MRHVFLAIALAVAFVGFHSNRVQAQSRAALTRVNATYPSGVPSSVVGAYITVTLTVSPSGAVTDVQRSNWSTRSNSEPSSRSMLASEHDRALRKFSSAAIEAARRWTFAPADVTSTTEVAFAFGATMRGSVTRLVRLLTPAGFADWIDSWWNPLVSPVHVDGHHMAPRKVVDVRPLYPGQTGESSVSGDVVLEVQTRKDGSVGSARVLRSIPKLDHYALDAALGWKYEAVRVDGAPVEAVITETVHFTPPVERQIAGR
jgi:TonB family protein